MRVLIVGGSSSVGKAAAAAFIARGDDVVATYASAQPDFAAGVHPAHLDLKAPATFARFVTGTCERMGGIDYVVLLSSILPGKAIADYSDALMAEVMAINFTAQAALVRELLPALAPGASVVAMSSISGQQGSFDPIYAASKAAVIAFVRSLATWHGRTARFNCIAPGLIEDTAMFHAMSPERQQFHRTATPTGELLSIDDLANVIVDLAQPQWRSLNGAVISLNGARFTAG